MVGRFCCVKQFTKCVEKRGKPSEVEMEVAEVTEKTFKKTTMLRVSTHW
jgi:hypothetical protein